MIKMTSVEVLIYLLICDMKNNEDELKSVNTDCKIVHTEVTEIQA